jgi:type IV pilus assembly protein PilW
MTMPSQRGISLVEIMVALAVGLFLTAGVVQIFLGNKQSYRVAEASARIQENARFGMEFLTRDLRLAGYMGCSSADPLLDDAEYRETVVQNDIDPAAFADRFEIGIEGFDATDGGWEPDLDASMSGALAGRDAIAVRGAFVAGAVIDDFDEGVFTLASAWPAGEDEFAVVASNCATSGMWLHVAEISSETAAPTSSGKSEEYPEQYAEQSELLPIETRSYYIRNNNSGIPSLYRRIGANNPQELIEGVEDMQIRYGRDSDGDGAANAFVPASAGLDWNEVVSVRVCLVFRSIEDNLTTSDTEPLPCPDSDVDLAGNHLRRVFTTTIGLRNRLP